VGLSEGRRRENVIGCSGRKVGVCKMNVAICDSKRKETIGF
jgi:hypothetical protein